MGSKFRQGAEWGSVLYSPHLCQADSVNLIPRESINHRNHRNHRILQCRRRPFGPSSLHRPQSGPIPVTPCPPDNQAQFRPIHLTRTSLDCGRKLEHPEETHADMGRMCKLHTNSHPRPELNPGPWHCGAAVLTTLLH